MSWLTSSVQSASITFQLGCSVLIAVSLVTAKPVKGQGVESERSPQFLLTVPTVVKQPQLSLTLPTTTIASAGQLPLAPVNQLPIAPPSNLKIAQQIPLNPAPPQPPRAPAQPSAPPP